MRVHELAKQHNLTSKEILDKLHSLGSDAHNHMSAISADFVEKLRVSIEGGTSATAPATPPPSPNPAKKETAKAPEQKPAAPPPSPAAADKLLVLKGSSIVVKELAEKIGLRPNLLIAELMGMNVFASISDKLDIQMARKLGEKHGFTIDIEKRSAEHKPVPVKPWEENTEDTAKPDDIQARPPIVTFMGHVDHGKTSLLDRIRNAMVAKGEAGGITQHIGAYMVESGGRKITFLDTPGHEAFTAMRARGAHLTDIAVIIVAADDGIMPQTREAIQHAQAAKAAIMIAINKIDLPTARVERVKQQLQLLNLAPEEWGGQTVCCEVSAQTGKGIDHLLEMILLQADILELKASRNKRAHGYIVEAQLESGMGPTATLLVKDGTLHLGDAVLCGQYWGRVKALINDRGVRIKSADPSTPVKCLGLSGVPEAGAEFKVCTHDRLARELAEKTQEDIRLSQVVPQKKISLDNLFEQIDSAKKLEVGVILKADVQGSLEAIKHALDGIKSEKVSLDVMLSGVGNITVNDVLLASASKAIIVGFNVAKENSVNAAAKKEGVEIRLHAIIYDLVEEIRQAMTGMLAPQIKEHVTGHARVLEVFPISKVGTVAGCMVTAGKISSRSRARIKRSSGVIFEGSIASLKRFQNDAGEVKEGQECGIRIDNFNAFEKGDVMEFYDVTKVAQAL